MLSGGGDDGRHDWSGADRRGPSNGRGAGGRRVRGPPAREHLGDVTLGVLDEGADQLVGLAGGISGAPVGGGHEGSINS